MKHLTILVPEVQNNVISIAAVHEIFSTANTYWKDSGRTELFNIELASFSNHVEFNGGMFSARPQCNVSAIRKSDLIIIPSLGSHGYQIAVEENRKLIAWIKDQHKGGAEIASMCTGAFIIAATGLLDGKTCSTHWSAAETFRTMFPKVNLQTDKLITDDNGIYTNGGAYSFLNLAIYLVEKYYDRETAIFCAKVFQVEIDRHDQSLFIIFAGQKMHGDEMVTKAQSHIESKVHEKISVEDLSSQFAVGRRNFDRRFIKATGNTPVEYSQRVKIEAAKKSLETSDKTISEVMYDVGYSDDRSFRRVFKKITGMSPLQYKGKYNKGATLIPMKLSQTY